MNGIAKIVLCSCLLGASQYIVAQNNYFVKGVLVDSVLHETEPYATVRIFPATDSVKPLKVGVTDNDGKFKEALPKPGEYRLTISSLGKQTVDRRFSVSSAMPTANARTDVLRSKSDRTFADPLSCNPNPEIRSPIR